MFLLLCKVIRAYKFKQKERRKERKENTEAIDVHLV